MNTAFVLELIGLILMVIAAWPWPVRPNIMAASLAFFMAGTMVGQGYL